MSSIMDRVYDYCAEIPKNTPKAMMMSFGVATLVETVITGKPERGVIAGVLSAVAALIHGLVSPFFKYMADGATHLSWGGEMCRTFTAIIGAGMLARYFGNNSIIEQLGFLAVIWGLINYLNPSRGDLSRADWIPLYPSYQPVPR